VFNGLSVWKLKNAPWPNVPASDARAERVRAILDHRHVVAPGNAHHGLHVAHQAVEVRWYHGGGPRRDGAFERVWIDRVRARIDVGEHRHQARDARQLRHDPERERGENDLAALRELERLQQVVERHPAERRARGARQPEPSRERLLERGDLGPFDETPLLLERRDGLLGVGDDARAVAGNRGQHVTLLAIFATSRRV
jgi:hypothetical protein